MSELILRNRQRSRPLSLPLLRRIARALLAEFPGLHDHALGVYLVDAPEMTELNQRYLKHRGSTDVITFDYTSDKPASQNRNLKSRKPRPQSSNARPENAIRGEIVICLDDVLAQARRFHTTWQAEVVRCLIHGVLHLLRYDDRNPAARRVMKRQENRLLESLSRRFSFRDLAKPAIHRRVNRKSQVTNHQSPITDHKS